MKVFLVKYIISAFVFASSTSSLAEATMSTPALKSWGILLYSGFDVVDIFGPLEYINTLPDVDVHLIAESSMNPVSMILNTSLHAVTPTHTLATAPPLDVLIVPGGLGSRTILTGQLGPTVAFINATYPSVKYLLSICTGNALTAASGVLDGRRATGNKRAWPFVTGQGPRVDWVPSARWVVDGNIWTSSGVEAGTDMIYAFISTIFNPQTADAIANTIEHAPNKNASYDPFAILYNTTGTLIPPAPTPPVTAGAPTKFGVLVYPGVASLETWAALEVLYLSAASTNTTLIGKSLDSVNFDLIDGRPPTPLQKGGALPLRGQNIIPDATIFNKSLDIEVLIVPGAPRVPFDAELAAFIAELYPSLRYVISVGTGAALVAQSGVAKGHQATTSKYFYKEVKSLFPSVEWVPSARWTVSDNGKLWSSSGGISVFDTLYGFEAALYGSEASVWGADGIEYIPHSSASFDPFALIWHTT